MSPFSSKSNGDSTPNKILGPNDITSTFETSVNSSGLPFGSTSKGCATPAKISDPPFGSSPFHIPMNGSTSNFGPPDGFAGPHSTPTFGSLNGGLPSFGSPSSASSRVGATFNNSRSLFGNRSGGISIPTKTSESHFGSSPPNIQIDDSTSNFGTPVNGAGSISAPTFWNPSGGTH